MSLIVQSQWGATRKDDLLLWYDFDEIQGATVPDKSGRDHSGTIHGAPEVVGGQFGKALHFKSNLNSGDPNGDHVVARSFEIEGAISVAVWLKYDAFSNWSRIIDFGSGAGAKNILLANQGGGNTGSWHIKQAAGGDKSCDTGNFWLLNEWMHVVATVDDNGTNQSPMKFYRNGELVNTKNDGSPVPAGTRSLHYVGRSHWGSDRYFLGWMDDLRMYSVSLTAEEIEQMYNKNGAGKGDFNELPVIILAGEAHMRIPMGADFTDPGATATDREDGDLGDIPGVVLGDVDTIDTSKVGDWIIEYVVKDSADEITSIIRNVHIFDPLAPVLTLLGDADVTHEATTEYSDAGATLADKDGNALDAGSIQVTGIPSAAPKADFVLTYNFKDANDLSAETLTRRVKVVDTTPPVLTMEGESVIYHQVGTSYVDPVVTALDSLDGPVLVLDSRFTPNQLNLSGYMIGGRNDLLMDFNENGGILPLEPVGETLWKKEAWLSTDVQFRAAIPQINRNDDYQVIFDGYFQASQTGDYEFGTQGPDDRSSFWIDLDRDGIFNEDGKKGTEVMTANWRGGYKSVQLEPGRYKVAIGHSEHGGGAQIDARFRYSVDSGLEVEPVLWLDGSNTDSLTLEDGKVFRWKGVGGDETRFSQFEPNVRPSIGSEINGRTPIVFDGNDSMSGDPVLSSGDDSFTYVILWRPHRIAHQTVFEQAGTGHGRRAAFLQVHGNYGFHGEGADAHNLIPVRANQWHLTGMILNGADQDNVVIVNNGSAPRSGTINLQTLNIGVEGFQIGRRVSGGEFFQGDIAEIRIFDEALGSRELVRHLKDVQTRWKMEDFTIADKYFLPMTGDRVRINPSDPVQDGFWGTGIPHNTDEEGMLTLTYTATDKAGNTSTARRTVLVEHIAGAPIITLIGDPAITHEAGVDYDDPGVRLRDSNGNPLAHSKIVVDGKPDGNNCGEFIVSYNFTNEQGKVAMEVTRTVTVADRTAPVITLNPHPNGGVEEVTIFIDQVWENPGATVTDTFDPDVAVSKRPGGAVAYYSFDDMDDPARDNSIAEVYKGTFLDGAAWDADGKFGGAMSIGGGGNARMEVGNIDIKEEWTLSAHFKELYTNNWRTLFRGNGTDHQVIIESNGTNLGSFMNQAGGFKGTGFHMKAADYTGWHHIAAVGKDNETRFFVDGRFVGQIPFQSKSDIKFIGALPGQRFSRLIDDVHVFDRALSVKEIIGLLDDVSDVVDTSTPGSYRVRYNSADSSGNFTSATRTVIVVANPALPILSLQGDTPLSHEAGTDFVDPGYTITDGAGNLLPDAEASIGWDHGLVLWYKFDESSGTTAADSSGAGHPGTLINMSDENWVAGKVGNALKFDSGTKNSNDASGQYLDAGVWSTGGALSISCWVSLEGFNTWQRMIDFSNGAGIDNILLAQRGNENKVWLELYDTPGGTENHGGNNFWQLGEWSHVVATVDNHGTNSSTIKIYKDGVLHSSSASDKTAPTIKARSRQWIGRSPWGDRYLKGKLDDLRIYESELSAAEVTAIYSGESDLPNPDPTIAGTYTRTYDFKNAEGKDALQVRRKIIVADTQAPTIALDGDPVFKLEAGTAYSEPGFSATDVVDGDVHTFSLNEVVPNVLNVNGYMEDGRSTELLDFGKDSSLFSINPVGVNRFSGDIAALMGDAAFRSIIPEITRIEDYQVLFHGFFMAKFPGNYEFGADGADDRCSFWIDLDQDGVFESNGDKGSELVINNSGWKTYNLNTGFYRVAIGFMEFAGNAFFRPRVRLPGGDRLAVHPANSSQFGNWFAGVSSNLDIDTPGTYMINYAAYDSSGNLGTASRVVNVVADSSAPSIILLGDHVVSHEAGHDYTDAGGNIADADGNIIDGEKPVIDASNVDVSKPGTYILTLSYTSADGKVVTPLKRTVNVVDTTPPTLVLQGGAETRILVGETYGILDAPGATVTDNVDPEREIGLTMPPAEIPGLVLHLDAGSPGADYNDGDVLTAGLNDLSGREHHAGNIQGDPTWKVDGLNGLPTINFDGDDMVWTTKDFENDLANYTMFTVARYTGGDNERVISTRNRNWLFGFHGNNTGRWHAEGWIANQGSGDTDWHLHVGDINDRDEGNFWRDGVQLATNSNGANDNNYKPQVIQLGGFNTNQEMSRCEVSEVVLFDRVIDDRERKGLVAHLVTKYALDVSIDGGSIDTSIPGTHEFLYTAVDSSGNLGSAIRKIIVEADNVPPAITLTGEAILYITPGTEFIDPGATATDRGKELEVAVTMKKISVTRADDLVGWWSFDDGTANDNSGNEYHGVHSHESIYNDDTPFGGGRSVNLNGNKYITVSDGGDQSTFDGGSAFSISAWVKEWPDGGWEPYVSKRGEGQGWQIRRRNNDADRIAFTLRGIADQDWSGTRNINDNKWHHLVGTFGGNKRSIYVDGVQIGSANHGGTVSTTQSQLVFGARDNSGNANNQPNIGSHSNVWLDDVRFYRASLTLEDVTAIYGNGEGDAKADTTKPGTLHLLYTVTDLAGNQSIAKRVLVVSESSGIPYQDMLGDEEIIVELGSDFVDPGSRAYDSTGKFLADVTATNPPDGKVPGTFEVEYNFDDADGKASLPVTRIVIVADTLPPVVTLKATADGSVDVVTIKAGQDFVDPGFEVSDVDPVIRTTLGHQLAPDAWFTFDDKGNPGRDVTDNGWAGKFLENAVRTEKGRYGAGLQIPTFQPNARFELSGNGVPLEKEWTATAWFKKLYPTGQWRSLFRGRSVDHHVMVENTSDSLGLFANNRGNFRSSGYNLISSNTTDWRHIAVVGKGNESHYYLDGQHVGSADQKGMDTIWRIGNWPNNQRFSEYIDDVMIFGYALSEKEISIAMNGNREPDFKSPGSYSYIYTLSDSSGNTTRAIRTIVVEVDDTAPVITMIGRTSVTHEAGVGYVDTGAFVSTVDGEPLSNDGFKIETDIDTSIIGTYTYTYTYTDQKGSVAIPVSRTIEVVDTTGPHITIIGTNPTILPLGEVFEDPGALAEDNIDGIVPVRVHGMTQPYVALDIGANGQRVQDGWIGLSGGNHNQNTIPLQSTEVVTPDGHTFTIQISNVDWRDPGDSASTASLSMVAEDFVKQNAGDIMITLMGLPSGDYVFRTYHVDVQNAQSAQINVHVSDANGQDILQDVHGNANINPGINGITKTNFANTSAAFKVKSNGADPVIIRLDGQGADVEVPLNGLSIEKPLLIASVGEYLLTYTAVDSLGHVSEATRTVIVSEDTTIPVIALLGDKEITMEAVEPFEDPGVTLKDHAGNDLDAALVQVSGKVFTGIPGTYVLAYDYTDTDGKAAVTRIRAIIVQDTTAPIITLNGDPTVTHTLNQSYLDAGATAGDSVDGAVQVINSFNFYSEGLVARWSFNDITDGKVKDLAGGKDGVLVGFDTGVDHINGIRGRALNFDGVDNRIDVPPLDKNLQETTATVWLKRRNGNVSSIFHTKAWGGGDLHFIVQNDILFASNGMGQQSGGNGNDFRSVDPLKMNEWTHIAATYSLSSRKVQVYYDGQLTRETTFTGSQPIRYKNGFHIGAGQNGNGRLFNGEMDELAIYDRALTPMQILAVMEGGQPIDVETEGQYTINYSAYDASGNKAMATRTIIVTSDPDAPIITLKGDSEIAHEAGNVFEDPGATVADKDGNALDATKIVAAGEVKGDIAAEYILTYDFTDVSNHHAMQIKRKVTVADTLAPVITINGEKEMRIGINSQFSDPGATAKDFLDGDIEVQTTIPIAVDTTAAGDFEIIYTSTDAAGNKAEVKRVVKVLPDTVPPVITLIGEANVTVNLGAAYDDEGTIAEDNIDGVLTPFIEDSGTVDAVDTSKEGTYVITYDVEDFSGNKAVQVIRTVIVKSADPFDNWLANLPAGQQSYDSDPDNDGIANLLEYAFGGDPAKADRSIVMPTFDTSGGSLKLTFCHLKASLDPNLNYMPEISFSLKVAWSTDGLTTKGALQGVSQDNLPDGKPFATSDYARATVTADSAMADAGVKQFLRISVIRE